MKIGICNLCFIMSGFGEKFGADMMDKIHRKPAPELPGLSKSPDKISRKYYLGIQCEVTMR
eukprot:1380119-Amorphochlora_amoeboformis.AAC.1